MGWAVKLPPGLRALVLPSLLFAVSGQLWWLMLLSAVRGLGFGVLTVCGSAAIAELSPPLMRGRAIGAYGLAISAPQILTMTGAPWLAEQVGFGIVFALGTLPVAGVPWALALARRLNLVATDTSEPGGQRTPSAADGPGRRWTILGLLVRAGASLLMATRSGGERLTFLYQT